MLNAGQSGFVQAPVTKFMIVLVVLTTVFGSIISSQTRLTLRVTDVVSRLQLWRLVTHNFVFTTPGELLFGVVLLYFFRQFERQMGSSRFAAFALVTSAMYTAFLAALNLFAGYLEPASGPYSLIFASMVYFFFETPKIYHFQILGALELSDKSFVYLLALQLLISSPSRSVVSCGAATLAGLLYRLPFIRSHADIPEAIVAPCSQYVLPLLGTNQRISSGVRHRRRSGLTDANVGAFRRQSHLVAPIAEREMAAPTISETNVETLVSMGFSREQSVSALEQNHDDVQGATEQLLGSSG